MPIGSYAPSFTSIITVPLSRTRTVCHWPMGKVKPATRPPGAYSMESVSSPASGTLGRCPKEPPAPHTERPPAQGVRPLCLNLRAIDTDSPSYTLHTEPATSQTSPPSPLSVHQNHTASVYALASSKRCAPLVHIWRACAYCLQ